MGLSLRIVLASATSLLALLLVGSGGALAAPDVSLALPSIAFGDAGGDGGPIHAMNEAANGVGVSSPSQFVTGSIQGFATGTVNSYVGTGHFVFEPSRAGDARRAAEAGGGTGAIIALAGDGATPLAPTTSYSSFIPAGKSDMATLASGRAGLHRNGAPRNNGGSGNSVFVGSGDAISLTGNSQAASASSATYAYTFAPGASGNDGAARSDQSSSRNWGGFAPSSHDAPGPRLIQPSGTGFASNPAWNSPSASGGATVPASASAGKSGVALAVVSRRASGGVATGLGADARNASATTLGYSYTPLGRGTDRSKLAGDTTRNSLTAILPQSVASTSPVAEVALAVGSTLHGDASSDKPTAVANGKTGSASSAIDVGTIPLQASHTPSPELQALSNDLSGEDGSLTNPAIEGYAISGPGASSSSVANLAPGSGTSEGSVLLVPMTVVGTGAGELSSNLTTFTSQASFGSGPSVSFASSLGQASVPEPTTLALLGLGLAALAGARRRRRSA